MLLNFQKEMVDIMTVKLLASLTDFGHVWSLCPVILLEVIFYDQLVANIKKLGSARTQFFLR